MRLAQQLQIERLRARIARSTVTASVPGNDERDSILFLVE